MAVFSIPSYLGHITLVFLACYSLTYDSVSPQNTDVRRLRRQLRNQSPPFNTSSASIPNCPRGCLCMAHPIVPSGSLTGMGQSPRSGVLDNAFAQGIGRQDQTGWMDGTQVICSRADLKILPRDLPRDTVKLDLSQNDISFIPSRAFDGLPINTLILDDNEIREIKAYAFAGMPKLKNLFMKNNPLDVLGQNSMSGIIGAVTINLGSNHIERVEREAFEDSANIQSINLAENPLNYVKTKAFRGLKNVQYLILSSSGLKNLEAGCFDGLSNVEYLAITQVPLKNLEANTFRGLKNVGSLEIRMAKIPRIHDFAFRGASNITRLTLSEIGLETLDKRAFRGLQGPPILKLDLSRNKLRYLHPFLFVDWAKHVIQLDLSDNPVSCNNCNLTWVTSSGKYFIPPTVILPNGSIVSNESIVYINPLHIDQFKCASPAYLKGKRVRDINFKAEFGCEDPGILDLTAMLKKDTTSGSIAVFVSKYALAISISLAFLIK